MGELGFSRHVRYGGNLDRSLLEREEIDERRASMRSATSVAFVPRHSRECLSQVIRGTSSGQIAAKSFFQIEFVVAV